MTDGTSQGLFIVVAIVIFGIFVVLAYILFEDTLSPAMANMFSTATEQTSSKINATKYYHVQPHKINDASDFVFVNGKITDYIGESKDVVIPYEINGEKVTAIGVSAFINMGITHVLIPNTVESIETNAFNNNNLATLYLPDSLTHLGTEVFEGNKLTKVRIGRGLTTIPNETFRGNKLKTVDIPPNIKSIHGWAFSFNEFEEITIPRTVVSLGHKFVGSRVDGDGTGNLNTLKKVRIPKELKQMIQDEPMIMGLYAYLPTSSYVTKEQLNMRYPESIVEYY